MAIITIGKKQFEKEIGKLNETMQNKVAMFGTPIEQITDKEIHLEIFPNRPDLLSYQGFKRSFLAFLGRKSGLKKYKINKSKEDYKIIIDSSVKNIRPYTACAIVKKLKLNSDKIKEIMEIQEKLHLTLGRKRKKIAIGIYPLEKIRFPITFKALEPDKIRFIPLESDREMSAFEILQRHPAGKEYASLLARKPKFPIFVDADKNILSMPPVINSQLIGRVTEKTRDVFVECSGFDLEVLKKCLNIIVTSLADMGGLIYQIELKFSGRKNEITPNLDSEEKRISLENTNKLLGISLDVKELKRLMELMGYNYDKGMVKIPAWRTDILHEVDLIEDVAIAYGYDKFVPEIPDISTIGEENPQEIFKRKFSQILTGLNMLEISNYHLTNSKDQFSKMGVSKREEKDFVEVEETKTDYKILRKDLSPFLLKIFSENTNSEYPQKIFEQGRVFYLNNNKIKETDNLGAAISPGNFTEIRQILEYFFRMIDISVSFREPEESPHYFIPGRVSEIILNNDRVGFIGEIHPKIINNWKLKMPVALFEIKLERIFEEFE